LTLPLHMYLLGDFLLLLGNAPVTTLDWPRLQSLLTYLVLHRAAPQSRTYLAAQLWPDSTEAQAHTNLRSLVHRLRHDLPEADLFLRIERQTLQWSPHPDVSWTLDVADFERALAQAEQARSPVAARTAREEAVALYRGDLLPGCYDEWILPERERLRQAFLGALEQLILLLERERAYPAAISAAQRLLRYDPLHETTYRHLMRFYAISGDRAAALRTYHTCATVLDHELEAEPGLATQKAYQRLLQQQMPSVSPVASPTALVASAPLVGRQPEWAQVQDAWQRASAGRPQMVVLTGEAGIGKTRLAEELLAWVGRQGMTSAYARCYAAEGELAYGLVATWLRADPFRGALSRLTDIWLTEVTRCVPDLLVERPELAPPGPLTEAWQRQRLFEALARAILGARQPLLLLLDDLQWCDQETLEWLHYLLRFDAHARLLIVSTVRPEETTPGHPLEALLATLRRDGQVTEIALGPLDAAETALLAGHLAGGDLNAEGAIHLYRETEGNPLFVVEAMHMGVGAAKDTGPQVALHGFGMSPTVQAVITARLAQLSPQARELVGLAAVIGRAFTFEVLGRASGGDEDTLVRSLDELWRRRIIREQGVNAYDFSHEKLREGAYAALHTAQRCLLHRRVAEALEMLYAQTLNSVSGYIATHYEQAGMVEQAVTYYQRAAEAAQRIYANAEALALYQRGLALLAMAPPAPSQQEWQRMMSVQLYEQMGDILALTNQHDEARNAYQCALAQAAPSDWVCQAHLHRKIAQTWETQHRFEDALQTYSRAEAILDQASAEASSEWWQEWIEIQSGRILIHYWLARVQEITELVEKTRPVVERSGTRAQRATFFQNLYLMSLRRDRCVVLEETLGYARSALAARQEAGSTTEIAWARFHLGFAYLFYGDLDEAETHMQAALAVGERAGDVVLQSRCLTYLPIVYRKGGQVEETSRYASRALRVATTLHWPEYVAMARANLAWVAWRQGNLSEAQANGRAALEGWKALQVVYPFHWTALWPLISVALAQDQLPAAIDDARVLLAPQQQPLPDALRATVEAATQAWDSGWLEAACAHLQQAAALAGEMGYL
jgi:DNA-binding SARP family transcriptional activator